MASSADVCLVVVVLLWDDVVLVCCGDTPSEGGSLSSLREASVPLLNLDIAFRSAGLSIAQS